MRAGNTTVFAALSVFASLATAHAQTQTTALNPVHAGFIVDQSPFDGVGDGIVEEGVTFTGLTSGLGDFRGVVEFDLASLNHLHRVKSATLEVSARTAAYLDGTTIIPIQIFSFVGGGELTLDDFNEGCFVDVFQTSVQSPAFVNVDVTDLVKRAVRDHERYLGFTLRTNVHGTEVLLGVDSQGYQPVLRITLEN